MASGAGRMTVPCLRDALLDVSGARFALLFAVGFALPLPAGVALPFFVGLGFEGRRSDLAAELAK
jgi:hypothetical protein